MRAQSATVILALSFGISVLAIGAEPDFPKHFDSSPYSQTVTECDALAAHPDDPNKVTPGVLHAKMDLPAAVAACRAEFARDPRNPRIEYQLARALSYSGNDAEGLPLILKSVDAHYPQAIFVTGYLYLEGLYGAAQDFCKAAELIHDSALYGRQAGLLGYTGLVIEGRFKGCAAKQDPGELRHFLEQAKANKPDFYQELLIDALKRDLDRMPNKATSVSR